MPSKTAREAVRTLEPYGFKLQGVDGGGHLVFRTDDGLAMRLSQSTKANNVEFLRRRAAQTINARNKTSRTFVDWLRKEYGVKEYGREVLRLNMRKEAERFSGQTGLQMINPLSAVKGSDFVEVITPAKVGGDPKGADKGYGVYALIGDLYGTDTKKVSEVLAENAEMHAATVTCDVSIELPSGAIAVCSRAPGHEGEHQDKYRKVSWAETRTEPVLSREVPDMPAPTPTPRVVTDGPSEGPKTREEAITALLGGLQELLTGPGPREQETQAKLDIAVEALKGIQDQLGTVLAVLTDAE